MNFAVQKTGAKSPLQSLVRSISREVNRHKLDYRQLKYVFRLVRERCQVPVPKDASRRLYELPTSDDLRRFYASIENPVHRLLFETLEGTGLRVSELASLRVDRIDLKANLLFVSKGKGGKDRIAVIGNRLSEKLSIYLLDRNNRYLFESNRGTKFTSRRIEQICQRYRITAGITRDLTPHTFRHIWNTRLAEAGVSKERRAILAGHEDDSTQEIYTHLAAGGIKSEIIEILDRLLR